MKLVDLAGRTFGRLTVKGRGPNDPRNHARWWCSCSCGNPERVLVLSPSLVKGATRSCGCLQKEALALRSRGRTPTNFVDLTGRTFGRLHVTGRGPTDPDGQPHWWCRCRCGNTLRSLVRGGNLTGGNTRSCGCLRYHPD